MTDQTPFFNHLVSQKHENTPETAIIYILHHTLAHSARIAQTTIANYSLLIVNYSLLIESPSNRLLNAGQNSVERWLM